MNADDPDRRRVLFTVSAKADLVHLKTVGFDRYHWQSLRANLERLAGCPVPGDEANVEKLRMCGKHHAEWYRWKHECIPYKPGIRVVFEVTVDTLTVWAVLERNGLTYTVVENRLRDWVKGVLG